MTLAALLVAPNRGLGDISAQLFRKLSVVILTRAELFAVRRDFALNARCAHASQRARWSKNPAARLAVDAGVGKAPPRKGPFMMRSSLWFVAPALALAACTQGGGTAKVAEGTKSGIDLAGIDKSVVPGDDFDNYANGAWYKTAVIAADRSSNGTGVIVSQVAEQRLTDLIHSIASSNPAAGTDDARIANYYAAYTNTNAIDQHGTRAGAQVLMPEELFIQRVVTLPIGSVSGRRAASVQSYANLSALNALTS